MTAFTIELDIEDVVETAVSSELDNRDLMDEDRAKEIFRELVHDEGEDFVQGIISGEDFATQDDVRNALSDYVTEDQIAAAVRDELTNCDFAEANDLLDEADVERIAERTARDVLAASDLATDLARRLDIYAQRVDELRGVNGVLVARLDNLTEQVKAQDATIDMLDARTSGGGELGQALTFFGLLRQAFAALR